MKKREINERMETKRMGNWNFTTRVNEPKKKTQFSGEKSMKAIQISKSLILFLSIFLSAVVFISNGRISLNRKRGRY